MFVKWPVYRNDFSTVLKLLILLLNFCLPLLVFGQQNFKEQILKYHEWVRFSEINRFYELNNYQPAWIGNIDDQKDFLKILHVSDSLGLNETDYQYPFIKTYLPGQACNNLNDSVDAEMHLTDAAIHFFTELKFGNKKPSFGYEGLKYNPSAKNNIASELLLHLKKNSLYVFASGIQPQSKEYYAIIKKLYWLLHVVSTDSFKDAKITSKKVDQTNQPLLTRLYQFGITDSVLTISDKRIIVDKVKKAQSLFDLLNDGVLRSTTLAAFNISIKTRIEELKTTLNYLRWIDQIKQNGFVLFLNIPSAYFMVYDKGSVVLDSKVVVGKATTHTPTLTSTITEVILYPYWNVPYKIATRELLPAIKRNPGYIDANNFQVLNKEGKVLNPYNINWSALSAGNFPYVIRQSTGCDNSLGIVKFNFYNPFTVYLHDTPYKALFSFSKRYFSHGCMRVEKPLELAHLLLGGNSIAIDTLTAKGCLNQQAPKVVDVERELPIMVLYSTVWYNKDGEIRFYDDIYDKLD